MLMVQIVSSSFYASYDEIARPLQNEVRGLRDAAEAGLVDPQRRT